MSSPATGSTAIPCLRYRDAPAAIEWLCSTLGFTRHLVVPGEGGTIAHAQLALGGGMVMLGSHVSRGTAPADAYHAAMALPAEVGGKHTQSVYLVVADPDAVHARAVAAGARLVIDLRDEDHGGRGFTCCDPEGHLWSIGSYDPWA